MVDEQNSVWTLHSLHGRINILQGSQCVYNDFMTIVPLKVLTSAFGANGINCVPHSP